MYLAVGALVGVQLVLYAHGDIEDLFVVICGNVMNLAVGVIGREDGHLNVLRLGTTAVAYRPFAPSKSIRVIRMLGSFQIACMTRSFSHAFETGSSEIGYGSEKTFTFFYDCMDAGTMKAKTYLWLRRKRMTG